MIYATKCMVAIPNGSSVLGLVGNLTGSSPAIGGLRMTIFI